MPWWRDSGDKGGGSLVLISKSGAVCGHPLPLLLASSIENNAPCFHAGQSSQPNMFAFICIQLLGLEQRLEERREFFFFGLSLENKCAKLIRNRDLLAFGLCRALAKA